ncbi:MAG TPA: heavy metal translocating P-type ATPase [Candidatus Paceibacterota bacterium]|nr:heavy metal translocating P-type ATPase [Candidatus Paceibacterota bacterium]
MPSEFRLPLFVLVALLLGLVFGSAPLYILATAVGLAVLGADSVKKITKGKYSLDYIAILAMVVALATREFLAGAVISLMILVSEALEAYASRQAESALKDLVDKIPKTCTVKIGEEKFTEKNIRDVRDGDVIFIRPKEIVPLDGHLLSPTALMDESNLTGEMVPQTYRKNHFVKSGLVNLANSIELRVSGDFSHSTYQKIVGLVGEAKRHPAKTVRLAERYNYGFTAVTFILAGAALVISSDPTRLLAVLVLATPCPLLIAAPVSFLGGLNRASRDNIIVKRPSALEDLSTISTIFFDKTGTLTLGVPALRTIEVLDRRFSEDDLLAAAGAIERHSLHPLAKAITQEKDRRGLESNGATGVREVIGEGITGTIDGKTYQIKKSAEPDGGGITLDLAENGRRIGRFGFDDTIKPGTMEFLKRLGKRYRIAILTGDSEANAERLFGHLGVTIHAHCLPGEKFAIVRTAQKKGGRVMMVGDGLNDAPALALADVGVVFSGSENSASIEAAAVAILGRDVALVETILRIARRSTDIARESIRWGIGLSILGMLFALGGYIAPVAGAMLQEGIDVAVILNALRSAG